MKPFPRDPITMRDLSGQFILDSQKAATILARRLAGERGSDLAREFDISPQVVCDIFKGRLWVA